MTPPAQTRSRSTLVALVEATGAKFFATLENVGVAWDLLGRTSHWVGRSLVARRGRIDPDELCAQIIRLGVRSIFIVSLVCAAVGFILGLQMAPPLSDLGQVELVPNIIAVAILRELGPLIAAIVLIGFAGASIAAELGTMVVGEEIEALEVHALNPYRLLVAPRVLATTVSMTCLAVLADVIAIAAGTALGVLVLDIPLTIYFNNTVQQVGPIDFVTGLVKAAVFGLLIGLISCANGLRVTGGASGVGEATTLTVVQSIVAIIIGDLIFTTIFYALGWV
ncbi:MAG: ABC transporter permease [Planctomycetota bacterium]|nr:MAG: ABC transporter permease [Planctomycetota bacterium]